MNRAVLGFLDTVASYSAAVTALAAGIFGLVAIATRGRFAILSAWAAAILALISAGLGVGAITTSRAISAREEYLKQTQPGVTATCELRGHDPLIANLAITSTNGLPYEYQYDTYTKDGKMLEIVVHLRGVIHDPAKDPEPLEISIEMDRKKLVDGYFEIRFFYKSLYADEYFHGLGNQLTMSGVVSTNAPTRS